MSGRSKSEVTDEWHLIHFGPSHLKPIVLAHRCIISAVAVYNRTSMKLWVKFCFAKTETDKFFRVSF